MKGVRFNGKHSYYDYGLILSSKKIGTPDVKTEQIDIAGRDGLLDLSEALTGYPVYKNRTLEFIFSAKRQTADVWMKTLADVLADIHGEMMQIILDDDPNHYFYGRVTVAEYNLDKTIGEIKVQCDCEPYRYEHVLKSVTVDTANCAKWNQLIPAQTAGFSRGVSMTPEADGYLLYGVNNAELGATFTMALSASSVFARNHKYYVSTGADAVTATIWVDRGTTTDNYGSKSEFIATPVTESGTHTDDIVLNCEGGVHGVYEFVRPVCVDLTALFGAGNEPMTVKDEKITVVKELLEISNAYAKNVKCILLEAGDNPTEPIVLISDPSSDVPATVQMNISINGYTMVVSHSKEPIAELLRPHANLITFSDSRHLVIQIYYKVGWL